MPSTRVVPSCRAEIDYVRLQAFPVEPDIGSDPPASVPDATLGRSRLSSHSCKFENCSGQPEH